jgi:hypothetical protein
VLQVAEVCGRMDAAALNDNAVTDAAEMLQRQLTLEGGDVEELEGEAADAVQSDWRCCCRCCATGWAGSERRRAQCDWCFAAGRRRMTVAARRCNRRST